MTIKCATMAIVDICNVTCGDYRMISHTCTQSRKESERRLSELEARMPRLTIVLSPDAPPNTEVLRDGVRLGEASLGTALPTDPGKHTIVAKAPGHPERELQSQAMDLVTLTNAAAITGALLVAGGAVVYFTAPRESHGQAAKGTSATPFFGKGFAGVVITHSID